MTTAITSNPKPVIKFADLQWKSFVAKKEKPEAIIYQLCTLDLVNVDYDFIARQGDNVYFKSAAGHLLKIEKDKNIMVFCRIPQLDRPLNASTLVGTTNNSPIPDVYFVDKWYMDKLTPAFKENYFNDLSHDGKIRAIVYSDIARACLHGHIEHSVYEKIMQNMPKCTGLKEQAILDKAYKMVEEGLAVRFKTPGGEIKFLSGSGHRDFTEMEYLCPKLNSWLVVNL